jgi:hypothetical protein
MPRQYLSRHCTLAYATTQHAALGRTVDTAHVLVDGLGDRQGLYVAMSRGRDANYAYCITAHPRLADIREGSRPAPELGRQQRLSREHAGLAAMEPATENGTTPPVDPISVLAGVMARQGGELSATETLERELSLADNLGTLGGIWDDLVRREQRMRFKQVLLGVLSADLAEQSLGDRASTWLWRSLREAEMAGLDGGEVLRQAVAERSLAGARDVARVLDSRVRRRLDGVEPQPPGRWADRVPDTGAAEVNRYLREVAEAMDDRVRRLGEHAAETQPLWARQTLGPVPDDPIERADWERRASVVAAYRERYGYAHPGDPIGPEPGKTSPEARAAWHGALNALGLVDGIDLRRCTDGELWLRRGTYERETAWAPPHVAEELRLMRLAERDAHVNAVRAEHEHHAAMNEGTVARHQRLGQIWQALEAKAASEAEMFAAVQETRRQWEAVTETTRRIATAADLELRRRYPDLKLAPLRPHPAEQDGVTYPEHHQEQVWVQPTLDGSIHPVHLVTPLGGRDAPEPSRQSAEADGQLVLGLTPDTAHEEIPEQVLRITDNARLAQAKLDELAGTREPGAEADDLPTGLAWPIAAQRDRDAVLQPPQPDVVPSAKVVERYAASQRKLERAELERG